MASSNALGLNDQYSPGNAEDIISADAARPFPRHEAHALPPIHPGSARPAYPTPCYFLDKIPIEIRNQIYGYLLLNPILAEYSSVKEEDEFGATASYGLNPSVIATCKQINQESAEVLYKDNTFFMAFTPEQRSRHYGRHSCLLSPLMRFDGKASFSTVSKVRRWRILPMGKTRMYKDTISIMTKFFVAISDSQLKSLELLLLPSRDENFEIWSSCGGAGRRRHLIRPLETLRNVEAFRYVVATESDVATCVDYSWMHGDYQWLKKQIGSDTELQELRELVQGDRPVDSLAKMYNALVS